MIDLKLTQDSMCMVMANNHLHQFLSDRGINLSHHELQGLSEQLLYNSYIQGIQDVRHHYEQANMDITLNMPIPKTLREIKESQGDNKLWGFV